MIVNNQLLLNSKIPINVNYFYTVYNKLIRKKEEIKRLLQELGYHILHESNETLIMTRYAPGEISIDAHIGIALMSDLIIIDVWKYTITLESYEVKTFRKGSSFLNSTNELLVLIPPSIEVYIILQPYMNLNQDCN